VDDGISRPGQAVGSANTGGICGFCQRSQGAKDQVKWLLYFLTVPYLETTVFNRYFEDSREYAKETKMLFALQWQRWAVWIVSSVSTSITSTS
ncbi:MAG: hypothetical protein LBK56_14820, partial [Gracilibacteraceae bacterium]|nr:hypothetical protein [Gracilibacteraceae bacterium]